MNFNKLMQVFSHKTKVHPVRMFAVILYAYSRGIYSTRDIEIACHENIKFRFLLQNSKIPDHSTISRFLTKIEAYANKYTFAWRGSIKKYSLKLDEKIEILISDFNNDFKKNKLFRKDGLELDFLYSNKKGTIHYFFNSETEKKVKYNAKFRMLSNKSKENISSDYGKQLRLNRSIQVEGAFTVLKEDMKLRKLKVRGKPSVLREIGLFCMGYNFNRYISRSLRNCKIFRNHKNGFYFFIQKKKS